MMRGGKRLMGLSSQFLGMRCFSTEIFVSKLSFYTTEEELKDIFSPFGSVKEARLMRDNQTGRVKGFGFVRYSSQAEAEKAIKAMDGRCVFLLGAGKSQCVFLLGQLKRVPCSSELKHSRVCICQMKTM